MAETWSSSFTFSDHSFLVDLPDVTLVNVIVIDDFGVWWEPSALTSLVTQYVHEYETGVGEQKG